MAYENDILTRNDNDELAVRTVQSVGDNPASSYDDVYTRDNNGKLAVRVVGSGGGSDPHNLGWYATQSALETAHPTAEDGDFAILGSTDTVWVWDSDTNVWKDTDQKGQVESVNGQTGTVVLTASDVGAATTAQGAKADTAVQPGDLATVATTGSYTDLTNTPTIPAAQVNSDWNSTSGVSEILNKPTLSTVATSGSYNDLTDKPTIPTVGDGTITITQGGVTKGTFTTNQSGNTTIDVDAGGGGGLPDQTGHSGEFLTTDGTDASWSDTVPAINLSQTLSVSADKKLVVFKNGSTEVGNISATQNGPKIVSGNPNNWGVRFVGNLVPDGDYNLGWSAFGVVHKWNKLYVNKISSGDNNISVPNITGTMAVIQVNTTITLTAAGWSSNTQTVSVTGVTSTSVVFVAPDPADTTDYVSAGILCTSQGTNSLTFTASTTPTNDIDVVIVAM